MSLEFSHPTSVRDVTTISLNHKGVSMRRLPIIFGMVTLGLALLVSSGVSQDTKKEEKKKEVGKIKGQLPAGFKDLGLSKDQIAKIYGIHADYKTKIIELEKKVKELKVQESQETFKILTDEQRERYLRAKGVDTKKKNADKD
jgi:hypothetical protein